MKRVVMGKLKRKASATKLENSPKKSTPESTMSVLMDTTQLISPTSKIEIFKLDVISCNGKSLNSVELGAIDLESIWKDSLLRDLNELSGYTSSKAKSGAEVRIQYQLKKPMSIRSISREAEFNHERTSPRGIEILRCRVVGLSNIRQVTLGEKVKATVINPNFDISPEQVVEWMSKFGRVHEGHRYRFFAIIKLRTDEY